MRFEVEIFRCFKSIEFRGSGGGVRSHPQPNQTVIDGLAFVLEDGLALSVNDAKTYHIISNALHTKLVNEQVEHSKTKKYSKLRPYLKK